VSPAPWRRHASVVAAVLVGAYLGALAADRSRIVVRGWSMAPTLLPGDVVLTRPTGGRRRVRVGQVVVLRDPAAADHLVIKRVHGLHGDQVYVLGDDPDNSTDGRIWGWLPSEVVRRVVLVRWPDVRSQLRWHVEPDQPDQPGGRRAITSTSGSSSATSPAERRP
jgi:nickel-type superoxide dismutase maturation protease